VAQAIGKNVAKQIPHGATLQLGIGALQESTAAEIASLGRRRNARGERFKVKVWTEIACNGLREMAEAGVIDKSRGAIRLGFGLGDARFYEFLAADRRVKMLATRKVNDPLVAGSRRKLMAVNSGLAVDLYGQACSEMVPREAEDGAVRPVPYSGVGGQVDFFRAARRSPGGQGFLTVRSTARGGDVSAITLDLPQGMVVTTNRYDIDNVVTEWGLAKLFGKDTIQRAQALVKIAHPRFRAGLARQGQERFGGDARDWQAASRVSARERRLAARIDEALERGAR
jgi:acyl-CoA hydrolase